MLRVRVVHLDDGTRAYAASCDMCRHEWEVTQRMFEYRMARFGFMKCPRCGCVLGNPATARAARAVPA